MSNETRQTVEGWIGKQIENIHTALPGTVLSYNVGSNRAVVQPSGAYHAKDGRNISYPAIYNVPVVFPTASGGTAGIVFPIRPGDGCLVVFAESELDDMLSGGDSQDQRRHSLNDAICIPGLYSAGNSQAVQYPNDTVVFCGGSTVRVGPSGVIGQCADGTRFIFAGGDLVVQGISHCHHTHPGDSGGTTGEPN